MKRFWVTFRYTLISMRGQILGWGLGLGLYGILIITMYDSLQAQQDQFQQMMSNYPEAFLAFFGGDASSMVTPVGFLRMYAFSMLPVIIGIFSLLTGSSLIARDEERGRLDLIIAQPVGRSAFFFGRTIGLFVTAFAIHLLGWLGFCVLLGGSSLELNWLQMTVPFLSLFVQVIVYASLALLLSLLLPASYFSAMVGGAIMIASYLLSSLAFMNQTLDSISKFLPYHYFQTVFSFSEINWGWLLGLLGTSLLMTAGAWLSFVRRDIRLSGEGGWHLPWLAKKRKLPETT